MKKELIGAQISFILLCMFILMFSCNSENNKNINYDKVKYIKFTYLPKGINPITAVSYCNDIYEYPEELIKDTTITDSGFIKLFVSEINVLDKNDEDINYDFRVKCILYEKEEKKEICFGDNYLTVFDGVLMKDNPKLFEILNKTLYK